MTKTWLEWKLGCVMVTEYKREEKGGRRDRKNENKEIEARVKRTLRSKSSEGSRD